MSDDERGFALTIVLITFLVIEVIGVGVLSVVMSDLHGAVANQLAMQSVSIAEAGLNYGVAELVSRASEALPTDEGYAGEPDDLPVPGPDGSTQGTFRVTVRCVYPHDAVPPACQDDAGTAAIDERDLRRIIAIGFVPGRPGRARRQIEATVRRHTIGPGDANTFGICGRERVELGSETSITADVGSNGDIVIEGPRRHPGSVRGRLPQAPPLAATVQAVAPTDPAEGLTGTYTWRVTFLDARGVESGGSPPTPTALLIGQHGHLINIPLGDSTIGRRRIYRTMQGSPRGPWFLIGEIPDNVSQEYTDYLPDEALRHRIPGGVRGSVTAAGAVHCSKGCAHQVDGQVRSNVREVVCPNFLPPPAQPGSKPATDPIIQTATHQTMRWASLHVSENEEFTIQTLSTLNAELHIHLTDIHLEPGSTLAITGTGTVYFHVNGTFMLGPGAVFGAIDFSGNLMRPSDRIQVLSRARDPSFMETGAASIRWGPDSKVSALVFAPNANIIVDRAAAFSGALYGKHIRITRSTGFFLDPIEGMGSEKSGVRPSPYQYLLRWYDNPNPSP